MNSLAELAGAFTEMPAFEIRTEYPRGKRRIISAPNQEMRKLHWRLIRRLFYLLQDRSSFDNTFGALNGGSTIANAKRHAHNRHFYQLDLTDAYTSVSLERLADLLCHLDPKLGSPDAILEFLNQFCAGPQGGLATGGPASPALFDLYCVYNVDQQITSLLVDGTYTRYLDDLTISSYRPIPRIFRKRVREVILAAGFSVNHKKARVSDLRTHAVTITGVVINKKGKIRPPDQFLKRIADGLRQPMSEVTVSEAHAFNGLVGYLSMFKADSRYDLVRVAPEVTNLKARAVRRVRELARKGLLPTVPKYAQRRFHTWFLDQVRESVPIKEVVGRDVKLRRVGRELVGLSPFTKEKTPSFFVSSSKKRFFDFSSGKTGDIFDYVMEMRGLSFPEAVKAIMREYNIVLRT